MNYAFSIADFLTDDIGFLPKLVVITDQLDEDAQNEVQARRNSLSVERPAHLLPELRFETDGSRVIETLDDRWRPENWKKYHNGYSPAFVVGSALERELATTIGAGHLSVSFPVANRAVLDRGYTGYSGGLRLTEDILSAIIVNRYLSTLAPMAKWYFLRTDGCMPPPRQRARPLRA